MSPTNIAQELWSNQNSHTAEASVLFFIFFLFWGVQKHTKVRRKINKNKREEKVNLFKLSTNPSSTDRNVKIVSVEGHDRTSNPDLFTLCMWVSNDLSFRLSIKKRWSIRSLFLCIKMLRNILYYILLIIELDHTKVTRD
jgi:hypothetical protein